MAKGEQKSNREVRKPKKEVPKKTAAAATTSSVLSGKTKPAKSK